MNIRQLDILDSGGETGRTIPFEGTPLLLDLLRTSGAAINAPCGGGGRCGRCRVLLSGAAAPAGDTEQELLKKGGGVENVVICGKVFRTRLACMVRLTGDCALIFDRYNKSYSGAARENHVFHTDNACKNAALPSFTQFSMGYPQLRTGFPEHCGKLAAFDLGTTTVSVRIFGENDDIFELTELNAQRVYGADVISRIAFCGNNGGLEAMRDAIRAQLCSMLERGCAALSIDIHNIASITVAANTTMQYILCGLSPEELGTAPYIPSERFGRVIKDIQLFDNIPVYIMPCTGGFTGGDLTACLVSVGISPKIVDNLGKTVKNSKLACGYAEYSMWKALLVCDLGTNGEIALYADGKIYVTSAAAGPALEGGCISCGSGCIEGAVCGAVRENGGWIFDVIGGGTARSLTGAALLDCAAAMLDEGIIDETGRMECEKYYFTDELFITQADIRQLQLAKGAIRAAAQRLLELGGISAPSGIVITGGLGYRAKPETVLRLGLLPPPADGVKPVFMPSLALDGACACLGAAGRGIAELTAELCESVELSSDSRFNELFVEYMEF